MNCVCKRDFAALEDAIAMIEDVLKLVPRQGEYSEVSK